MGESGKQVTFVTLQKVREENDEKQAPVSERALKV